MRRIILSLIFIGGAAAVIASGATGAFFSDTESSTGNTFAAGSIDLKVDNDSYYNGNRCTEVEENVWQWVGTAPYPVSGTTCTTSWNLDDLSNGRLFFNFTDLKPDDESEDTISLHVQNDAWACMDVSLTSNDDRSSSEPELVDGDTPENINNTWDGELAQNLQFFWWADDGDNVYEADEQTVSSGIQTLFALASTTGPFSVALADSEHNVWTDIPGPVIANTTTYIAKAWCFGNLSLSPVAEGGGVNPSIASGITCDGTALNNLTQTDGATLDIAFRAIQSRNNPNFLCGGEKPRLATITVIKEVTNDNGGNNVVPDFQLFVDNGVNEVPVTSNVPTLVAEGNYTITETGVSGYVASFSGDCDESGQLTLNPGDEKVCTITNNDLPANITLIKSVINDNNGTATANSAWGLKIDDAVVPNNTSVAVSANSPHSINENGRAGYHFVSITGSAKCPAVLGGSAILDEGEAITCTITNDDDIPALSPLPSPSPSPTVLNENFGTGTCLTDIPGWDEDAGESCTNGTVAAATGSGDNTVSPEGGRFGLLSGNNGYLCRSVNATGLSNLVLNYYWRGDTEAEDNETGSVSYFTSGTCAAPGTLTALASHELDDGNNNVTEPWSVLQTINLPASLNNSTFFIRFSADSNGGNESFRLDGATITAN